MSAVNAVARPRIDVEPAVDHDTVSFVHRDALCEVGVVIHLEDLAGRGLDLKSLVIAVLHRVAHDGCVERDLGATRVVLNVLVQALVVGRLAAAAREQEQRGAGDSRGPIHVVASASRREIRPS